MESLFAPRQAGDDQSSDLQSLSRYFEVVRKIADLQREATRQSALAEPPSSSDGTLDEPTREEASLRPAAMVILRRIVERELASAGFDPAGLRLNRGSDSVRIVVRPPVNFQIGQLPRILLVAPRDGIRLDTSLLLREGLDLETIQMIEERFELEDRGYVALVENIGGIALFPPLIPPKQELGSAVFTIAHEWTHQYLLIDPLGRAYFFSDEARGINETVADIVGNEIRSSALARLEQPAEGTVPSSSVGGPDFGQVLAETREKVQVLLDRGEIDEAESYMAARQRELAGLGYPIRRLNTAYLAWYGAYAGTGNRYEPALRKLRTDSATLRDFVDRVSRITTYDELVRAAG